MNRRALLAGIAALAWPYGSAGADTCGPGEVKRRGKCYPASPGATSTPAPATVTPVPWTATATPAPNATRTATSTPVGVSTWQDLGAVEHALTASTVPGRTISNLTIWNGRLFCGYGDYSQNTPNPMHVVAYDLAGGSFVDFGAVNSVALLDMIPVGNQLAIPYTDPAVGTYPTAAFMNPDESLEIIGQSGPRAWHVYGAVMFNGKRYLSGSHWQGSDSDAYGVWRDDAGRWTTSTFTPNSYYTGVAGAFLRVYGLFVIGSTLYAQAGSTIYKSTTGDLGSWSAVTSCPARMKKPLVSGSMSWHGSNEPGSQTGSVARFNGSSRTVLVSSGVRDHTVGDDGRLYILMSDGRILNESLAMFDQAPPDAWSIAFVGGRFYCGTSASRLLRSA